MSTRYADDNSPLNQERYMSSPEYAELRGVLGGAATAKASILSSPRKRSLIFFLQALSLEPGGLKAVAEKLIAMFPQRVGTERMIAAGLHTARKLSDEQVETILDGLVHPAYLNLHFDESAAEREERRAERAREISASSHDPAHYQQRVQKLANSEEMAAFLVSLCVDPRLLISEPGKKAERDSEERALEIGKFLDQHEEEGLRRHEFKTATFRYFQDVCGALYDYQRRYTESAAVSFAATAVAKKVHQTLDACLKSRRMVLIEGESDAGKSTSAEAWCRMHKGEARFVRLQGVTNKTVFFRALARALGVASTYTRTAKEMQARVEDVLQRSGLMLVLDESQYAFAQSERIYSRPELVDWIYTACCNHGVPVALVASPLFSKRLHQAERQTIWNSAQFKRRIYRYEVLPGKPTPQDIALVVKHQMPDGEAAAQKWLAGYALSAAHPFTAIADTLADAAQLAEADGRARVLLKDLQEAVGTFRSASEKAKRDAFDRPHDKKKPGRKPAAAHVQADCGAAAETAEGDANFTERSRSVAALETPAKRETAPVLADA